ncbi:redoxin domain-containing protein [Pedobacter sp. SD-b]|uniref:Redoxin domain-containing protein n=1 Tax=Pedobacter segetis TaxID=2793069 RepID=A0ABS1BFK4_9SPHI|nr:redoxin domain-containing protein [Pedobacter segetis]MBK0381635.1 redoxin domain-containing protein [Pedobacter segetis]
MKIKAPKIILLFICLLAISIKAKSAVLEIDTLHLGDTVSGFNLPNTVPNQPKMVSLDDYKNRKGVILIFMTNGCYHCIRYRQRIKDLHTKYAKDGYPVVTINPSNPSYAFEETNQEMVKNAIKEKYEFPYLEDSTQNVTRAYNLRSTPTAYVLQRQKNNWVLKYKGPIDNDMDNKKKDKTNFVQNVVDALIHHKKDVVYPMRS